MYRYEITIKNIGVNEFLVRGLFHAIDYSIDKENNLNKTTFVIQTYLNEKTLLDVVDELKQYEAEVCIVKLVEDNEVIPLELKALLRIAMYGLSYKEIEMYFITKKLSFDKRYLKRYLISNQNRYYLVHKWNVKEIGENDLEIAKLMNAIYRKCIVKNGYDPDWLSSILYFAQLSDSFVNIIKLVKIGKHNKEIAHILHAHALYDDGEWIEKKIKEMEVKENTSVLYFILKDVYITFDQKDEMERKILENLLFLLQTKLHDEFTKESDVIVKNLLYKTYMLLFEVSADESYQRKAIELYEKNNN